MQSSFAFDLHSLQIRQYFPEVVQIFRWNTKGAPSLVLYFATTEIAKQAIDISRDLVISNINLKCQLYRVPRIGGLYNQLEDVVFYLLRTQYASLNIVQGTSLLVCFSDIVIL